MRTSRWLPLAVFAALALLLGAGVLLSRRPDRDALPSPLIGKPAPAFALPYLLEPARTLRSETLRGIPYVLNVWGSWCPECRVEHPALQRLVQRHRVRLVGYNLKDEPADAAEWLTRLGNPYTDVIADQAGNVAIDWGIYGAPETFVVDAGGVVRWKHVGALDDALIEKELLPALAAAGAP